MKLSEKLLILLLVQCQGHNYADYYNQTGTLAERNSEKLVIIQSEKEKKIHYVIKSPQITEAQIETFSGKCGISLNVTNLNTIIPIIVMESLENFVTHDNTVKPTKVTTTTKGITQKYNTIAEAVEKYFWGKDFTQKSLWEIIEPKNSRLKIAKINDGSLKSGFSLREVCNNDESHIIKTKAGTASGLAIIIDNFDKNDLTVEDEILITYNYQDKSGIQNLDCDNTLVSTEKYGQKIPVTIFMTNCEIDRAVNKTSEHFIIKMNVNNKSAVCNSRIMEIQMYQTANLKFNRKRRQALMAGLAAGGAYLASSLFTHLVYSGKNEDMIKVEKTIDRLQLQQLADEEEMKGVGQKIGIEIDLVSKALEEIQHRQCIGQVQLDISNFASFVRKIATVFCNKILYTIEAMENNIRGNDGSVTTIVMCEKINNFNKNPENRKICADYIYKNEIKVENMQIHKNGTEIDVIITIKAKIPKFTLVESEIYEITTVPIPTRKLENGLFEYLQFQNVPEKFVTLTNHNQTLAIGENMCEASQKYLFCHQSLFDNIHGKETSCINAILGRNRINSCDPRRIISISDCISKIKLDTVIISVSDSMEINAHIRDLQIHRIRSDNAYKKGTYVLTKKELSHPAYLSCKTTKVFVDLTESSEKTIVIKNRNFSEKFYMEEVNWLKTLSDINEASDEKIKSDIESLHPLNENLKSLLNQAQIKRTRDIESKLVSEQKFFDNKQLQVVDNELRPYIVLIIILISVITIGILFTLIIIKIKSRKKKRYKNVRFITSKL